MCLDVQATEESQSQCVYMHVNVVPVNDAQEGIDLVKEELCNSSLISLTYSITDQS